MPNDQDNNPFSDMPPLAWRFLTHVLNEPGYKPNSVDYMAFNWLCLQGKHCDMVPENW